MGFGVLHCVSIYYVPTSVNRLAASTSHDAKLWPKVNSTPNLGNGNPLEIPIINTYYLLNKGCLGDKFVIRYVTDVLLPHPHPPKFLQTHFVRQVRQKQTL